MSRYVHHYDSPLLDDIHNYFPALLYEPNAFRSVSDVLSYIRMRTQSRFNLFNAGQNQYVATMSAPPSPAPVTPPPRSRRSATVIPPTVFPTYPTPPRTFRTATSLFSELYDVHPPEESNLIQLLAALRVPTQVVMEPTLNQFTEPVVVHPTAEQIDRGTSIDIMGAEGEQCAICQDAMSAGIEVRTLDACDHRFHINCIDTWFMRNVHCPICRHDIREPVLVAAQAQAQEQEQPPTTQ